jgi:hypothetical protein
MKTIHAVALLSLFSMAANAGNARTDAELMARMGFTPAEVEAAERVRAQGNAELNTISKVPQADRDAALARIRQLEATKRREDAASRARGIVVAPMRGSAGEASGTEWKFLLPSEKAAAKTYGNLSVSELGSLLPSERAPANTYRNLTPAELRSLLPSERAPANAAKGAAIAAAHAATRAEWCATHPVECAQQAEADRQHEQERAQEEDHQQAQRVVDQMQTNSFMGHSREQLKTDLFMAGSGGNGPQTQQVVDQMQTDLFMGHSTEQFKTDLFMLNP